MPRSWRLVADETRMRRSVHGVAMGLRDSEAVAMTFLVYGAVRSKKNSQRIVRKRDGTPFILQSKQHNAWAAKAIPQMRAQMDGSPSITTPVNMSCVIYTDRWGADLLNLLASISDALEEAGAVKNDRLIVSLNDCRMLKDADNPRVWICLSAPNW